MNNKIISVGYVDNYQMNLDEDCQLTEHQDQCQGVTSVTRVSQDPAMTPVTLLTLLLQVGGGLAVVSPPLCSLQGLKIGAGLGSVAGAVGGVAATGGAATLATCPSLMISTLGHGLVGIKYFSTFRINCSFSWVQRVLSYL